MSADNGVYIGRFSDGEFRVIHAQAIENLWYPHDTENATYIYSYYKDGKVFGNRKEARDYAFTLADEIRNDDFGILEYGVCDLDFEHPFSQYQATANMKELEEWDNFD